MRFRTARAAILVGLAIGLVGCSTTSSNTADGGTKSAWWQSLSLKRKVSTASSVAVGSAPAAPNFDSTAAASAPTVTMPGGYAATGVSYQGGTQYPVTPYPPTNVPCGTAGCAAGTGGCATGSASYAAGAAPSASSGFMPPANAYSPTPSNPYAAAVAATNPYAAPAAAPANPYAAATAAPTNRYAAPAANATPPSNPYATPNPYGAGTGQTPAYTAAGPYSAPQ